MMLRGLAVLVAVTALAAPASASAAKFCVQKPKCVQAGGTAHASIGSALTASAANGGNRDRIELGAKQFNDGPFAAGLGNPVDLVGAGRGKTTLSRTPTTPGFAILSLVDPSSRITGLSVVVNDGAVTTGIRTPGRVDRVSVTGQSLDPGQFGVELGAGGSLTRSRATLPTGATSSIAVHLNGDGASVRDSTLRAQTGLVVSSLATPTRGTRLRVTAASFGVFAPGDLVLDQATIRMIGVIGGIAMQSRSSGNSTRSLIARHVTAVGNGGASSVGASASVQGVSPGDCPRAKVVLRNSILRAFDYALHRSDTSGCASGSRADIDLAWSALNPGSVLSGGNGAVIRRKGVRNVNPRFVKQGKGNYHLKASSPLIDKGQKGKPKKGESKRDLDGRKRVLDGDGNGKARRDVGAFERKRKR